MEDETMKIYDDEDIEVTKFKAESLQAEVNKFVFTGFCDEVSSMYLLDKDRSKGHEALMYLIKHFSRASFTEDEYIKRLYYHDLSGVYSRISPGEVDFEYVITEAREHKFAKAIQMPEFRAMRNAVKHIQDPEYMNPYGKRREEKFNWLDIKDNPDADFLFFVGSTDLLFNHDRVEKMMFLLEKLKISYTMTRDEEDCGYLPRVLGRAKASIQVKELNKEVILRSNIKNIITSDPHCYHELSRDLEHSDITVWYLTELIANKIFSLNSRQLHKKNVKAVFQPSTILPAKMDKLPVQILQNIGCEIFETQHTKDHMLSTGEGGGFSLNYPDDAVRIAKQRIDEALEVGAEAIISDSPHDFSLLSKAKRKFSSKIKVYDLLSLVADAVKWTGNK
jgi:Fe-S oxidoreductase